MYGLFTAKETGRKNIVHKLSDMTQLPNHCVSCRVLDTQYIKFSQVERKKPIKQESWFGYRASFAFYFNQVIYSKEVKTEQNCLGSRQYMAQNFDKSFFYLAIC